MKTILKRGLLALLLVLVAVFAVPGGSGAAVVLLMGLGSLAFLRKSEKREKQSEEVVRTAFKAEG